MQYHRFGHMLDVLVKVGDTVTKGEKIGTLGTGNGQWSAHLHYDCPLKELPAWTGYVFGMTKEDVAALYSDPKEWRMTVAPWYDHMGYEYLEHANYGTAAAPKWCYHPGEDLNGKGAGNADLGDPIFAPCDGEVVYVYDGPGPNGGWGKLVVIKEVTAKDILINTIVTEEKVKESAIESSIDQKEAYQEAVSIGYTPDAPQAPVSVDTTETTVDTTPVLSIHGTATATAVPVIPEESFIVKLLREIIEVIQNLISK